MATDQLSLYNGALLQTGSRRIANLSVNEESRRTLDDVWQGGQAINECLEKGFWKFAMRIVKIDYDTLITPSFGYRHAFHQPTDMVHWYSLCTDEFMNWPLEDFQENANVWYADQDSIYLRYVSNDASY